MAPAFSVHLPADLFINSTMHILPVEFL